MSKLLAFYSIFSFGILEVSSSGSGRRKNNTKPTLGLRKVSKNTLLTNLVEAKTDCEALLDHIKDAQHEGDEIFDSLTSCLINTKNNKQELVELISKLDESDPLFNEYQILLQTQEGELIKIEKSLDSLRRNRDSLQIMRNRMQNTSNEAKKEIKELSRHKI